MTDLINKKCVPCEGGVPALDMETAVQLLTEVPEWELDEAKQTISRKFSFKGFYKTMAFVNAVAWIANNENHHPDMHVGFNYCHIYYKTHAARGLTENDFISAAKVDALI